MRTEHGQTGRARRVWEDADHAFGWGTVRRMSYRENGFILTTQRFVDLGKGHRVEITSRELTVLCNKDIDYRTGMIARGHDIFGGGGIQQ